MSKELYAQSSLHRMVRYDARSEILSSLGDLSGIGLRGNQIIVAPYVQSGILWSNNLGFPIEERLSVDALYDLWQDKTRVVTRIPSVSKESIWQGKVALVVKIGREVGLATCGHCKGLRHILIDAAEDARVAEVCPACAGLGQIDLKLTRVGSWVFYLQESTRGVSLRGPGWAKSRVLEMHDTNYEGWPCKFIYETDIYGDVDDPDMVV